MTQTTTRTVVAGIHPEDIAQIDRALDGMTYPACKWQLIAHASQDRAGRTRACPRTITQLWALPASTYASLAQVLTGAARTARGHPARNRTPRTPPRRVGPA